MSGENFLLEEETSFKRFYRLSSWWVENRTLLKRIVLIGVVVIEATMLLWASWHLLNAFAIRHGAERLSVASMVAIGQQDLHQYTLANAAVDLEVDRVQVFSIGDGRYDLYTTLENPNDDWWARFTYTFEVEGVEVETKEGFVLPGETKPLVAFAYESEVPFSSGRILIDDVSWQRVDRHMVGDYAVWETDRLNLSVSDAQFVTTEDVQETIGTSRFTIENQTAFSYYDVGLFIVLKRGNAVVGVNRTVLPSFDSGESLDVRVNWFGTLPDVTQVEVIPEIDLFDLSGYKALEGETPLDTRTRVF